MDIIPSIGPILEDRSGIFSVFRTIYNILDDHNSNFKRIDILHCIYRKDKTKPDRKYITSCEVNLNPGQELVY